jgi:hypothetical protein
VVSLAWTLNENRLPYTEIEIYCRELGQTEWKLAGIAPADSTSALVLWSDSQANILLEAGKQYEFSVQSFGATAVNPTDSPNSNALTVTT